MAYDLSGLTSGISSIGKWFTKGENLKGLGTAAVAVGGLYNDYQQSKYAKKLLNLNEKTYNRSVEREEAMDDNLNDGYANSALAARRKKTANQPLVALG